jgi:hypothetical protein
MNKFEKKSGIRGFKVSEHHVFEVPRFRCVLERFSRYLVSENQGFEVSRNQDFRVLRF